MGNKNHTPSSKKSSSRSQKQQLEILNSIQRQIQAEHSSTSLASHNIEQSINEENNSGQERQRSRSNMNSLDMRSSISIQNGGEKKLGYHREQNNGSLSTIPNNLNKSRNSTNQQLLGSESNLAQHFPSGEIERKDAKKSITELEVHLNCLIRGENYFGALEKLFEILFLNKKVYGSNSEQVAFSMHRMSSILCLLGRLEEALKYEYESCQIRKNLLGSLDVNIAKSLIYISKLLWYFKKYIQSFYYILEAYNTSEHPINRHYIELKQMIGEVALEMSNIAHENEQFILSFKLRVLAFQSKRTAFLYDESYIDEELTMLSHEVWNYKQGVFLLQMIPTRNYSLNTINQIQNQNLQQQEDNCPICYIEFNEGDQLKELLCSHIFHSHCIDRWVIKNQKCPMCRKNQDLHEYLVFQQNRLKRIQKEQNDKLIQKQQRFMHLNSDQTNKSKSQKFRPLKKLQISQQQSNVELVQLSPRTSQTFLFLQKELQNTEVDMFMHDYNQHFNLLPLPTQNENLSSNNNSKKQNTEDKQNKNTSKSCSNPHGQQPVNNQINKSNDRFDNINFSSITSSNSQQQQQEQKSISSLFNLNLIQANTIAIESNSHNNLSQVQLINQFGDKSIIKQAYEDYDYHSDEEEENYYENEQLEKDQDEEDNYDDEQEEEEEEEEQKHNSDISQESETYYVENNHVCFNSKKGKIEIDNKIKKETEGIIRNLDEQIANSPFLQIVNYNEQQINDNQILYQANKQQQKKYIYYPQYEGIMADGENFDNIQEFNLKNYQESNDSSSNSYSDFGENQAKKEDFLSQEQIIINENEKLGGVIINGEQLIKNQQNQQKVNTTSLNQDRPEECLLTEPLSTHQDQPLIKDSINTKLMQSNNLYFGDEQVDQQSGQEENFMKHISDQKISQLNAINQPRFNKNQIKFTQKEKQCTQNCLCCHKFIDDSDVNFDEEGISESNNKMLAINGQRANEIHISQQQKTLNNNTITCSLVNINPNQKGYKIQNNLSQNQQEIEEKIVINNMPTFNSKITINNASKNYYLNDEYDIFDRKVIGRCNNQQRINIFEDDEKENKFLYESNNILNNNKYSQMNFY